MFERFLESTLNVGVQELPRLIYGWLLRFFLRFGLLVGWTTMVAVIVTRFSISALPILFLGQALFAMVGMLISSVVIDRMTNRQFMTINTLLAVAALVGAAVFYEHGMLFLILALMGSGLFLSQVGIVISSYLEDYFTPLEAERVVPSIESAETIGGILGGLVLANVLQFSLTGATLIWLWIGVLLFFLVTLHFGTPKLPLYLERLDKDSRKKSKKPTRWNALFESLDEIRRVPFLQLLLTVLIFHWMIGYFLEFLYTKAVEESVHGSSHVAETEVLLAHGLGLLHIFFHSSALVVELFVSSRVVKGFGVFAGFALHTVMTFLSSLGLMLGYGFVTAVLARNNFEMTTIIQRNAYETSYYAFRYGTLRALREFFEGLVYPVSTIGATLLILGIEWFFVADHLAYVLPFLMLSFTVAMGIFSFQLQRRYTEMAAQNLDSTVPLAQHHAVEIISQKGHDASFEKLMALYKQTNDAHLQKTILKGLAHLNDVRAIPVYGDVLQRQDDQLVKEALKGLVTLGRSQFLQRRSRRKKEHYASVAANAAAMLEDYLIYTEGSSGNQPLKILAAKALRYFDAQKLVSFLKSEDFVLQMAAVRYLRRYPMYRSQINALLQAWLERNDAMPLAGVAGRVHSPALASHLHTFSKHADPSLRLVGTLGLFQLGRLRSMDELIDLLLLENEVSFEQVLLLIYGLTKQRQRRLIRALMLLDTELVARSWGKIRLLLEACNAEDEAVSLDDVATQLTPHLRRISATS